MTELYWPRKKSCKKWIIVSEKEISTEVVAELKMVRLGTIDFMYTFDSEDIELNDVYVTVAKSFENNNFDSAIIIFQVENKEFVY